MNLSRLQIFVQLLATLVLPQLTAEVVHGPIYNPATGNLYFLLSQKSWTASEMEAQLLGGHLATINDNAEQEWIFRTFGVGLGAGRLLWIGLNDAADEGVYRWSSGADYDYSAWAPGEPNATQTTEDFVAIYYAGHSAQGLWNDWSNIQADPIGIPLMGVAEVHPRDFAGHWRTLHHIDFENIEAMDFNPGPVPPSAYLRNQFVESHGVRFSSSLAPAVAVQLGEGHATSGSNGFAGMMNGNLDYSAPVQMAFLSPLGGDSEMRATIDFVSVRLDQFGGGEGTVRLTAFDLLGDELVSTNVTDIGGRVVSLSSPGIHRVIFEGNGSVALDDLFFVNSIPVLPQLHCHLAGETFRVSWSIAYSGWSLEFTESLNSRVEWKRHESPPIEVGDEFTADIPIATADTIFFRLTKEAL